RFISSRLLFFYDDQQRVVLNSANLLIPSPKLGITPKQLAHLLNSEIMNWIFQKIFHTHKILRGDLELLPLHTQFFQKFSEFSETAYWKFLGINQTSNGTFVVEG
ncbi:MAG: hypothetical protein NZ516_13165, partial [Raineya sp.]|nr:hypothetical protein [Raineya sp.]